MTRPLDEELRVSDHSHFDGAVAPFYEVGSADLATSEVLVLELFSAGLFAHVLVKDDAQAEFRCPAES